MAISGDLRRRTQAGDLYHIPASKLDGNAIRSEYNTKALYIYGCLCLVENVSYKGE